MIFIPGIIFEIEIGDMKLSIVDANFPKDENILLPHFHPMFEFQYALQNKFELRTNNASITVSSGSYALIPSNLFHWTIFGSERFNRFAFLFSVASSKKPTGEFSEYAHYRKIFDPLTDISICDNVEMRNCLECIIELLNENHEKNIHKLKIYFSVLFMKLSEDIAALHLSQNEKNICEQKNTDKHLKIRTLIGDYITENYAKDNILKSLSDLLHMSTRNTSRTVKKLFGVTLGTLVLNQRMNYARTHLCETDIPIREIAYLAGYNDYSTFFKTFKKQFGCSPDSVRIGNIANKDRFF